MSSTDQPALLRIEQVLSDLAKLVKNASGPPDIPISFQPATQRANDDAAPAANGPRIAIASAWVKARTARDSALGADLFSDRAWAMLLDLYINGRAQAGIAISVLSHAANVPLTTGTRWIALLERADLVRRGADAVDRRRILVSLTEEGVRKIELALDRAG